MNATRRFLWLAIIAVLGLFVGTKWNQPLAAWLAPILALRFYRDSPKARTAFLLLWVASAIPAIVGLHGSTFMATIHPLAEVAFFVAVTPLGLIPYVIDRAYHRRIGASAWATLVFPIATTALDFFMSSDSPWGTFGAAGYSQRGFMPAMQVASVVGIWGIPFVISWAASLVNALWERRDAPSRLVVAFAAAIVLILGAGALRIATAPALPTTVRIAGFSLPDGTMARLMNTLQTGDKATFRREADKLHVAQLAEMRRLADDGAQIIVLQEGAGIGEADQVAALVADAGEIARESNSYIVLPIFDISQTPMLNAVQIIDPTGAVALTHVKYGGNQFESTQLGDQQLRTIETPYGTLSAVICWDADFPAVMRQAGNLGVDLLFVPANDWREVKDIHAGMATFRAVENGMAVVRQTGSGVSLATDSYGRTVSHADSFATVGDGFTGTQQINLAVGSVPTLYLHLGDVVGQGALVGLALLVGGLLLSAIARRVRRPATPPQAATA